MIYLLISQLVSLLLDLFAFSRRSKPDKDLQILLLRQQVRIVQRQHPTTPRVSRWDKLALAVLANKLTRLSHISKGTLDQTFLPSKPDTPWLCREPWS